MTTQNDLKIYVQSLQLAIEESLENLAAKTTSENFDLLVQHGILKNSSYEMLGYLSVLKSQNEDEIAVTVSLDLRAENFELRSDIAKEEIVLAVGPTISLAQSKLQNVDIVSWKIKFEEFMDLCPTMIIQN